MSVKNLQDTSLVHKTKDTWLETYWDVIQKGKITIYKEKTIFENNIKTTKVEAEEHKFVVGNEIKIIVQSLIEDLSNQDYYYDTTESDKRIIQKENLCFQSKAPYFNKPLKMMLHQKAFWEVLYSFKLSSTGLRRFTKALLLVSRKNGKSVDMAADAMCDLFFGKGGQDICCCSNDDKTASLIWKEIAKMRKKLDANDELTRHNQVEIASDMLNITIFRMSAKTQNKDGRNIDKTYYDEAHDSRNSEIADACWQSMSIKDEPLFIILTTEGVLNDMYLDQELKYARKVLYKEVDDIHYLPFLFTQDSPNEVFTDKDSWQKSNPSLIYGVKKWSFIEDIMNKARFQKSLKASMLCKDFNIKQNSAQSWLDASDYDYEQEEFDLEDFRGAYAIGAVDLSQTTDLSCAKLLLMRRGDKTKYIYTKYFIPVSKLENSADEESGADYKRWAKEGYIIIHDSNAVDTSKIADWFYYDVFKKYNIRVFKVGYDQRYASDFINKMGQYGWDDKEELVMIYQSRFVMSEPMKLVEADLKSHYINYNNNPVDKYCLANTSFKLYDDQSIMPIKKEATKRIDGAVTKIILYATLMRFNTEYMEMVGD